MKKLFVIFNFSQGKFYNREMRSWTMNQNELTKNSGFDERELAEEFMGYSPDNFEINLNYTILTFYKK
jgi:hypothetical protein